MSVPTQAHTADRKPTFSGTGPPVLRVSIAAWSFWVLLICSGTGLLSIVLGPDNYWDLRFYHLYAPWAYLHGRYLYDIAPAQLQGFFNPTADLFFMR